MLLAHQGSDIEYKNFYTTKPHAAVLTELLGREVKWIDDVCGPAAREAIRSLKEGEILLLDNVRFVAEEQRPRWWKNSLLWQTSMCVTPLLPPIGISQASAALSRCFLPPWAGSLSRNTVRCPR